MQHLAQLEHMGIEIASIVAQDDVNPSARAYFVGGWCRDRLMGRSSPDIDMEVFGVAPDRLTALLQQTGRHVIVPSSTGVTPWKVILGEAGCLDITVPLQQVSTTENAAVGLIAAPEIPIEDAARRRDFTCNTIYYDPMDDRMIDPFDATRDMAESKLRLVPGCNLNAGIMIRACRFSAWLGYELVTESREAIINSVQAGVLAEISPATLKTEWLKMLMKPARPSIALKLADKLGVLEALFPDLSALKQTPQDTRHHPEGSVFNHTTMVVDAAAGLATDLNEDQQLKLLLAALFHDIGKPATTRIMTNPDGSEKITAHGHEQAGLLPARLAMKKLSLGQAVRRDVLRLIACHMKPAELARHFKSNQATTAAFDNKVRQLVKHVLPENMPVFLRLCRADQLGRSVESPYERISQILGPIEASIARNDFLTTACRPLLNGKMLRDIGFSEDSHDFGLIIRHTEAMRDSGRLKTTADAMQHLLRREGLKRDEIENAGLNTGALKEQFFKAFNTAIAQGSIETRSDCLVFLEQQSRALHEIKSRMDFNENNHGPTGSECSEISRKPRVNNFIIHLMIISCIMQSHVFFSPRPQGLMPVKLIQISFRLNPFIAIYTPEVMVGLIKHPSRALEIIVNLYPKSSLRVLCMITVHKKAIANKSVV